MTEEWRRQLTDWASEWLEAGEDVRAIVVCQERHVPSPGEAFWQVLSAVGPAGGAAGGGGSGKHRGWCALMSTTERVLVFPLREDGLDPPRYTHRLGEATVRVKRGLFGSAVYVGHRPFDLPPRTRKDALEVADAAS